MIVCGKDSFWASVHHMMLQEVAIQLGHNTKMASQPSYVTLVHPADSLFSQAQQHQFVRGIMGIEVQIDQTVVDIWSLKVLLYCRP